MAEFFYTQALNRVEITQQNLQAMFDDIGTRVNTSLHDMEQFRRDSVRYKHLKKPFRVFASIEKTGTALYNAALIDWTVTPSWNWTLAQLKHIQSVGVASNNSDAGNPVLHLSAQMYSHEWEMGSYEIGIGYSINNGAAFTHWPNTNSFFGATRAHTNPMWSAKTVHYHTGVAGTYWPGSMYAKREAHCVLGGADFAGLDLTTVTDWAIGIRRNGPTSNANGTNTLHELDTARLTLIARDIT